MGLFDFFKKKDKEEKPEEASKETTETVSSDEPVEEVVAPEEAVSEESTVGWDAITAAFEALYPDQKNPKHYGTLIKYMFGGPDPLDGISVYDGGDFWHFVSYGLSELYTKDSDDPDYSGWGIEFTFKLKKSGGDDEAEIRNGCGLLQNMAKYIFNSGRVILPDQYIYTKQEAGIDANQTSHLTGFVTASDDLVDTIHTPHGKVEFVTLIGATDAELRSIYESGQGSEKVREMLQQLGSQVTDYSRQSLI